MKMSLLKLSDAFCYICRGVLIKPVTVPCLHVFCFTCFEQSMQETSYSCPLCRRRISNWVRKAKKTDKLINVELWGKIQEQFRDQVNSKLRGEDDGLDERLKEECPNPVNISGPGEVAKEFSKLIDEYQAEREKLQAAEELASKELITKLTEEEKIEMEALKRDNKLKIAMDEELAKKLHREINKTIPTSSRNNSSNQRQRRKHIKGPMDNFLKNGMDMKIRNGLKLRLQEKLSNRSASSDSTDSIQPEMHHFKPIKVVPRTPPKRYPDGKVLEISLTEVKPLKVSNLQKGISSYQTKNNLPESKKIHSPYSAFIGKGVPCLGMDTTESPRKRLRPADESESGGVLKEITLGENSDTNSIGQMDAEDNIKRKRNSPVPSSKSSHILMKSVKNDFLLTPKIYHFNSVEGNPEENENSDVQQQFDTQDYLSPDIDMESDLIEEQKRIEKLILQEKSDRELALKLSQEWEGRYELRKKPKQKQVTVKGRMKRRENKKLQQTLIGTLINTRSKSKS